jgi:hypothetical protein|tara:strand:+ start:1453 stop:1740 length:288 start_codon:yes stop_codon:yes gene_type:complete
MRYGTYTTFDAPTEKQGEALQFLRQEFSKIDGSTRKISNPHDFGTYPSFEVDHPMHLKHVDEDMDCEEIINELDEWNEKAEKITAQYNKKYEKYL